MLHIKRIGLTIVMLLALSNTCVADIFDDMAYDNRMRKHEVALDFVSLGSSAILFNGPQQWGAPTHAWFYNCGVGYTYWLNHHIGLRSGLEFTYLQYTNHASNLHTVSNGVFEVENNEETRLIDCTATVSTSNASEEQTVTMVHLPLQVTAQIQHLYLSAGVTIATPITTYGTFRYGVSEYRIMSFNDLSVSTDDLPVFGDYVEGREGHHDLGSTVHPVFCNLALDLGWKMYFDQTNMVSVSVFFRRSLNRYKVQQQKSNKEIVDLSDGTYKSHTSNTPPERVGIVESLSFYECGVRLCYNMGLGDLVKKRKKKHEDEDPQPKWLDWFMELFR